MLAFADPLPYRPSRILVAGVSGAGKTTLARRIATIVGAPHTELDALHHGPHWTVRAEFSDDVHALTAQDAWTTEWQYASARTRLAQRADLVVWLDLPFYGVVLPRVVTRTLRRRIRHEVLWNGNVEPPLHTVLTDRGHIVRWSVSTRKKYPPLMAALERDHPQLPIVHLRTTRQVETWVMGPLADSVA